MILVIFFYHWCRRYLADKSEEMDIMAINSRDYTVHAYGFGEDADPAEVKEFFEKHGRYDKRPAKVIKVNFPYKIKKYIDNTRRFEDISDKLEKVEDATKENKPIEKQGICCCKRGIDIKALKAEQDKIANEKKSFEDNLKAGIGKNLVIGQAFVTFDTQAEARAVELKYGRSWSYQL